MPKKKRNKVFWAKWRVHTPGLIKEIANCAGQPVLRQPLQIFSSLLAEVATRAIEINDPKLNALMVQLTLYSIADPDSPDYNPKQVESILGQRIPRMPKIKKSGLTHKDVFQILVAVATTPKQPKFRTAKLQ